ncbi:MAG: hypothetical protein INR71_04240, partial [Terriglobus roseus]|nr:hypothetical protein [Terriglobus roseus]
TLPFFLPVRALHPHSASGDGDVDDVVADAVDSEGTVLTTTVAAKLQADIEPEGEKVVAPAELDQVPMYTACKTWVGGLALKASRFRSFHWEA